MKKQKGDSTIGFLIGIIICIAIFAAWFNHIITCFETERWGFLVAGAIFFPVAVIHGIYLWLV